MTSELPIPALPGPNPPGAVKHPDEVAYTISLPDESTGTPTAKPDHRGGWMASVVGPNWESMCGHQHGTEALALECAAEMARPKPPRVIPPGACSMGSTAWGMPHEEFHPDGHDCAEMAAYATWESEFMGHGWVCDVCGTLVQVG